MVRMGLKVYLLQLGLRDACVEDRRCLGFLSGEMFFVWLAPVAGLLFKINFEVIREDRSSSLSEGGGHSTGNNRVSQEGRTAVARNRL